MKAKTKVGMGLKNKEEKINERVNTAGGKTRRFLTYSTAGSRRLADWQRGRSLQKL